MPELRYIRAVNRALEWALASRDDTIIFGEDVAVPGGPFGASKGLHDRFGAGRIFDTPISESGFLGMALGAAMTGLRPIAEVMYGDFLFVAMDQVVNQIANVRYSSNGRLGAPLVVRLQQGWNAGSCAQHSHSVEGYLAHTPGVRIAVPATPDDAYQMLRTAVLADDPVFVIESRALYPLAGHVRLDAEVEPIGGSRTRREGRDVTLVSWGAGLSLCLDASDVLAIDGIEAAVIDLRWLSPLDMEPTVASVNRTGRCVVVHEANLTGGFGAEIAARISESCWDALQSPVLRVGLPDLPMPAAPVLQAAVAPSAGEVVAAAHRSLIRRAT